MELMHFVQPAISEQSTKVLQMAGHWAQSKLQLCIGADTLTRCLDDSLIIIFYFTDLIFTATPLRVVPKIALLHHRKWNQYLFYCWCWFCVIGTEIKI